MGDVDQQTPDQPERVEDMETADYEDFGSLLKRLRGRRQPPRGNPAHRRFQLLPVPDRKGGARPRHQPAAQAGRPLPRGPRGAWSGGPATARSPDPFSDQAMDVERAYRFVLDDPAFRVGTRPDGPLTVNAKRFIVEMYEKFTGKRLLE